MLLENLKPIFNNIGLTEIDLKIYLHLLKHPGQNVNQLAKAGNVTRTNCYNYIESLEKLGLIYTIPESKVNRFNATQPAQIKKLLKDKVNNSQDQIKILESLSNKLEKIQSTEPLPEVRYFKGQQGIEVLLKEAFQNKKIDIMYNSQPDNPIFPQTRKKLLKWIVEYPSTKVREIRNSKFKGTKELINSENYQLRYASESNFMHSRVILVPNKIYLIKRSDISEQQTQLIGICIEDADIYKTQQMLFDLLWENSIEENN